MLITRPKAPKVTILRGRDNIFKAGFRKKFSVPRMVPAIKKVCQSEGRVTPETIFVVRKKPAVLVAIWKSKFHIYKAYQTAQN